MYYGNWFKTKEDAERFQKEHGGALAKNEPRSHSKREHLENAQMFGFDPDEFKYSVLRRDSSF